MLFRSAQARPVPGEGLRTRKGPVGAPENGDPSTERRQLLLTGRLNASALPNAEGAGKASADSARREGPSPAETPMDGAVKRPLRHPARRQRLLKAASGSLKAAAPHDAISVWLLGDGAGSTLQTRSREGGLREWKDSRGG